MAAGAGRRIDSHRIVYVPFGRHGTNEESTLCGIFAKQNDGINQKM